MGGQFLAAVLQARAMFPTRVVMAMLFYAIVMSAIVVYRPRSLFDVDDRPLRFGAGSDATVFDIGTVAGVLAIVSFALFTLVDVVMPDAGAAVPQPFY